MSRFELFKQFILKKFEEFSEEKYGLQKELEGNRQNLSILKIIDNASKSCLNDIINSSLEECQQECSVVKTETRTLYYEIIGRWSYCRLLGELLSSRPNWCKATCLNYNMEISEEPNDKRSNPLPRMTYTDRHIERCHYRFPIYNTTSTIKVPVVNKEDPCSSFLASKLCEKDYFPPTILIQRRCKILNPNDQRVDQLIREYNDEVHHWFLKDSRKEGANGIVLLRHPAPLESYLLSRHLMDISQTYILQPQLPRLHLTSDQHKFDIRVYLLLLFHEGHLQAYLLHDCIVRVAAQKYNSKDDDVDAHLTNICFQLRRERGQKRVYLFQEWWPSLYAQSFPRIVNLMNDVFRTLRGQLNKYEKSRGFTLLGGDILITEDGKPWLLEFNFSPSMFREIEIAYNVSKKVIKWLASAIEVFREGNGDDEKYGGLDGVGCECFIWSELLENEWVKCWCDLNESTNNENVDILY
ncbi:7937_t:CDS:2 [Ambispora leptoticha]|uniref:Tubulin--tyrosine ligase-like protein 9 n=1 Tax=Ambispora leptoticha TaxID=144679 RepID=A0A9N8ZTL7_9GLOM|nr:7937_t:CDS:2 [Ambispora leptoticha]